MLIGAGRINVNQQLRLNLLHGHTVLVLIEIRQFYVDQAVRFKRNEHEVQSPERVAQVIAKVRAKAQALGTDPDLVEKIYREMIQHFIQRELKEFRP